ncbi:MAG: restriction endonuclease subunit S [Prevotellaceae bacterium]|nr:restriction endonuclease subunit S [Candidatus Colivivens caballi]
MSEWKECTLGEVLILKRGYDLPHSEMKEGNIPVAGSNGIIGNHNVATDIEPCITVGRSGSAGSTFYYNKAWAHNTTLYIDDFRGNSPKYLYYLLLSLPLKKMAGGSAVPSLNRNHIHPLLIKFPTSLETQHRIASILSSLDDKIAVNRRICENLEAQAQALFKHWFIDFAPFKNGKFVESELGMIPEGWKVGKLSDLGDIICGKTPSKANKLYYGGNVPFIKIPDMHGNMFVINSEDNLSNEGSNSQLNKLIPEFSIMVSCIATVGLVSMNTKPSHTNQQINTIVPYVPSYRYYIYENLKLREKELLLLGSSGTTTYNVNTKTFSSLKILMPDLKVIEDFDKSIKYHFEETLNLYQENLRLSTLRDTLLPKLMSGQIKV